MYISTGTRCGFNSRIKSTVTCLFVLAPSEQQGITSASSIANRSIAVQELVPSHTYPAIKMERHCGSRGKYGTVLIRVPSTPEILPSVRADATELIFKQLCQVAYYMVDNANGL